MNDVSESVQDGAHKLCTSSEMDESSGSSSTSTATALQQGVQSTFEAHHNEIRRRSHLDNETINSRMFERVSSDGVDDPFEHADQKFVVFSLSQAEFAPCPRDSAQPAVCVYGAFETIEDAHEHARLVTAKHPQFSVFIDRSHKWIVAAATMAHLTDAQYVEEHTKRLLEGVRAQNEANQREFDENVANRRAGEVTTPSDEPVGESNDSTESAERSNDRIHADCKIAEHRSAAVSFVCDDASPPEFLFRVYACYETDDAIHRYVCNTCGDHVSEHHIDVIKTSTWVFPQRMHSSKVAKEVYRSSELNKVMNTHKKNPQEVERFYREHPDVAANGAANGAANDWHVVEAADASSVIVASDGPRD